jgi:hypothetical protein
MSIMTSSGRRRCIGCELASLFDLPHMTPIPWFVVRVLRCGLYDRGRCYLALGAEPVLSTIEPGHPLDEMWPVSSKWQRCNLVHLE